MFDYQVEQKSYKIGKYSIGGDPRSTPTAVIGTLFYYKQKNIFEDEKNGIIVKDVAEELINKQQELADKTGLVPGLDVILSFEPCIKPILDFVIDYTDVPIILDAPSPDLKLKALDYVMEAGIQDRLVYNSINPESDDEEFKKLEEAKIKNFVLLGVESAKWTTQGRVEMIDELVKKANAANFADNNYIVDTAVMDVTTLGLAMNAIEVVKNKYGFPCGTGAHNAVDTWKNIKEKFGNIKKYASVVSSVITLGVGADFLLYGPCQHADLILPNVAFVKAAHSQLLFDEGKMAPPGHPVFKIG